MKIVLLGPGLMGSQIACEYALGGHEVVVLARRPDVARERIERGFSTAREHGLATPEQVAAARERMTIAEDDRRRRRRADHRRIGRRRPGREEGGAAAGRGPQPRRHRRLQYLLDPDHGHRRRDRGRGADGRRALLESSAADADGRGHSWRRNSRGRRHGDDRHPARAGQATGARRSRRAGFRLEPAPARAAAGGGLAGRERRRLAGDGRRDRARRAGPALALHRTVSNRGPRRRGDVRAGGEPPLAGAVDGDLAPGPAAVARRVAGDDGTAARAAGPRTGRRHASGPRAR